MRVRIETRNGGIDAAARRRLDEQIRLGLGREAATVERARATLGSGVTRQTPDLRTCRLRARLRGGGPDLAVDARGTDWAAAAREAAIQLGLRIQRHRQSERLGRGRGRTVPTAESWRRVGSGSR